MANHAKLSPSKAKQWASCPGSIPLTADEVRTSSEYADEGTAAHFLASECLLQEADAAAFVGGGIIVSPTGNCFWVSPDEVNPEGNYFAVDDEMAEHVQVYLDYVRALVSATNGELFVEVSVPLDHMTSEEGATGTSDTVIVAADEIIVVDLKYGRGVEVQADENPQLMMYASGAVRVFSLAGDFRRARLAICQPRVSRAPPEWVCPIEELRNFEDRILEASSCVADAEFLFEKGDLASLEAYLHPSEGTCKWCTAKAKCPKLAQHVQETIGASFPDLLTGPKLSFDVSADELGLRMSCLDLIEDWCKATRAETERRLFQGDDVPGYKLVQGRRGSRAWANAEEAEAALKAMRLKKDEMYSFKLISPTEAEKVLKTKPKLWEKVLAYITQSEGKPSVAPVSDKRPPISVTPTADDFSDLA